MKKVIAIDIDDVIIDLMPLRKQVMDFYNVQSPVDYGFSNWSEEAKRTMFWAFDQETKMSVGKPIDGTAATLKSWSQKHHLLYVTARNTHLHEFTVNQLCNHFPMIIRPYQIYSAGGDKEKLYRRIHANIVIDDKFENIISALNCPTVEKCYLISNEKTTWNHHFRRLADSSDLIEIVESINDIML